MSADIYDLLQGNVKQVLEAQGMPEQGVQELLSMMMACDAAYRCAYGPDGMYWEVVWHESSHSRKWTARAVSNLTEIELCWPKG
jgi:hypothetical protein